MRVHLNPFKDFFAASLLVLFILLVDLGATVAFAQPQSRRVFPDNAYKPVPGVLIVGEREDTPATHAQNNLARASLSRFRARRQITNLRAHVLEVPEDQIAATQAALVASGQFRYVERDHYAYPLFVPNDPLVKNAWHLDDVHLPEAWDVTLGSANLRIGIIDSGIDPTHSDLIKKLVPGKDFTLPSSTTTDTSDNSGHGTNMAGAAAADTNNGIGVAGACPFCSIMPLRVMRKDGSISNSDIAAAITYAADNAVKIINISLAGIYNDKVVEDAVNYAWKKDVLIFAGMGNTGTSIRAYPAGFTHVVAVGATSRQDTLSDYSTFGSWMTITTPGDVIATTAQGGGYATGYGTSIATALAAGIGGLARSANPNMTNADLFALLQTTSDDLGMPGFDQYYGWGKINALKLVKAASKLNGAVPPLISPSTTNLFESQTQQFSVVAGAANQKAQWWISPSIGTISGDGLYKAPDSVSAAATIQVLAALPGGEVLGTTIVVFPTPISGRATLASADTGSLGDWKTNYGLDGYMFVGETPSLPANTKVTTSPTTTPTYLWSESTDDPRGLVHARPSTGAIAGTWYDPTSFVVDIEFPDSNIHQVAFYMMDWEKASRRQNVQVLDVKDRLIYQTAVSDFSNSIYLVWNLSGHVKVRFVRTAGPNAVLSGIFFGTGSQTTAATFVRADTATRGNWSGVYGDAGYNIINDSTVYPSFVSANASTAESVTWSGSATDDRALQKASDLNSRIASAWYSSTSFDIDVQFRDNATHRVTLYFLDWQSQPDDVARAQKIEIVDSFGKVLDTQELSGFSNGTYLTWDLSGHVKIRATNAKGPSAVVNGLFFQKQRPHRAPNQQRRL